MRCLRSAAWADEIVVVDSGSSDKTLEIARSFTDRIYFKEFSDYSSQKNFALSKAAGDWALSLDADEEISSALQAEILGVMSGADSAEGYQIPRRSYIFGRQFRFTGTAEDRPVRLFKKGRGEFVQPIHERLAIRGRVGQLHSPLMHYTYPSVHDHVDRLNRYTSMEADHFIAGKKKFTKFQVTFKPILMFLRLYFLKQGWRDGIEGFLFSALSAYYVFVKHMKHFEKMRTGL